MALRFALLLLTALSATAPPAVVITLQRTACFGACPDYTVRITGDGRVSYEGRRFVRVKGRRTVRISPAAVAALVEEFQRTHYFDLKDEYTARITDMPTTTTSIRIGSRFKRVVDYYGAPPELTALENRIDEVAGSRRWVSPPPAK